MTRILIIALLLVPSRASASPLESWALALMIAKSPPAKIAALPSYPGWSETAEQRTDRYRGIASAAVEIGRDRSTIAKLLAVSFHESGWARDVDLGPCYRGVDGKNLRCDGGRAACMMQVRTDVHKQWKTSELFASREACFRAGLEIIRRSERACARLGANHAFDVYAGGWCVDDHSLAAGHVRGLELLALAQRFRVWEAPN